MIFLQSRFFFVLVIGFFCNFAREKANRYENRI